MTPEIFINSEGSNPLQAPDLGSATLPPRPQVRASEAEQAQVLGVLGPLVKLIDDNFRIGSIVTARQLKNGVINDSYIIGARQSDGSMREYFVRRYSPGKDEQLIKLEHSVLRHLTANGFDLTAELALTRAGESYVKIKDSGGRERFLMLSSVLPGEDKYKHEENYLLPSELRSVAATLGRYHNTVSILRGTFYSPDFVPAAAPRLAEFKRKVETVDEILKILRQHDSPFVRLVQAEWPEVQRKFENLKQELPPAAYKLLPHLPVHADLHPGNMRFKDGKVSGLFDFDFCSVDARAYDLGLALVFFCTQWSDDRSKDGSIDPRKFNEFIKHYSDPVNHKQAQGVGALSKAEMEALPVLMEIGNGILVYWFINDYAKTLALRGSEGALAIDAEYSRCLSHRMATARWLAGHRDELRKNIENAATIPP